MKHDHLTPKFCHYIPEDLEEGILYISMEYEAVMHKCACGCGTPVSTPITNNGWKLEFQGGLVTLSPSIGNFQIPCKTHYYIQKNQVVWC